MWGATKDTPRRNDPVSGEMESPRSLSRKSGKKLLLKWQWNTCKGNGKNLHKWIHLVSNTCSFSFWCVRRREWLESSSHTSNHLPYLNIITTSLFFEFNTYKSGIKNWQARAKLTHVFHSWLTRSKFSLSSLHSVLGPTHTWANVYKAKAIKRAYTDWQNMFTLTGFLHTEVLFQTSTLEPRITVCYNKDFVRLGHIIKLRFHWIDYSWWHCPLKTLSLMSTYLY